MKSEFKLIMVGILAFMAIISVVTAASVTPVYIAGANNDGKWCSDVIPGSTQYEWAPKVGTSNDPSGVLTIVMPGTGVILNSIDFSSSLPVLGVVVKDGTDGGFFYDYRPAGVMADTYLTTPIDVPNPNSNPPNKPTTGKEISHVNFCFGPSVYPPPPPVPTPEFPTLALPLGMLIGIVGLVYSIKSREN